MPFNGSGGFTLPSGGSSGQPLISNGSGSAQWGEGVTPEELDDALDAALPAVTDGKRLAATGESGGSGNAVVEGVFPGLWELVEEKTVTGSAVQTLDFDATLDGNVDGAYMVIGQVKNDTGTTAVIHPRINAATAVGDMQMTFFNNTTITGARSAGASIEICRAFTGKDGWFELLLPTPKASALTRYAFANNSRNASGSISDQRMQAEITTPASTTQITSLGVAASVASGLGVGSKFWLARRKS